MSLPSGAIRATVLIENILAAFETHEILHALRHHAGICFRWSFLLSFDFQGRLNLSSRPVSFEAYVILPQ